LKFLFHFIHDSDLHIGKRFGDFAEDLRGKLREHAMAPLPGLPSRQATLPARSSWQTTPMEWKIQPRHGPGKGHPPNPSTFQVNKARACDVMHVFSIIAKAKGATVAQLRLPGFCTSFMSRASS